MKVLTVISTLSVLSVAFATVWTNDNGLTLSATHWQGLQSKDQKRTFKLKGQVSLSSVPDGLTIHSEYLDCNADPDPKNPKVYVISQAIARQNVKIIKTVKNKSGSQVTDIEGPAAKYVLGAQESVVSITGATLIKTLDETSKQTMAATGSSGVAYLDPSAHVAEGNGLRRAVLEGPVHARFNQAATKTEKAATIDATSTKMTLENQGQNRKITLSGNVHINGPDIGDASGINQAVFVLAPNHTWTLEASK